MKAAAERRGPLKWLLAAFTNNWGLKLLALALAVIIYHSLKSGRVSPQIDHDRNIFQRQ
ncbi:MAG: hypothetical protein IJ829_00810 [Kiritimatiellae bacterium]|nr:hypothetical protein [Kiritimatiellia bacterium]